MSRYDQTADVTMAQTMLQPARITELVTPGTSFYFYCYVLSSLTDADWQHYIYTGQIPQTYDPRNDKVYVSRHVKCFLTSSHDANVPFAMEVP